MKIEKIDIKDFRIFNNTTINLGSNLTCISGYNGVGKSTLLALLSNVGELKRELGTHINGNLFRGEFSEIIHGDKTYEEPGEKCTVYFKDIPLNENPDNPYVNKLSFRSTFQKFPRYKMVRKRMKTTVDGQEETITILNKVEIPGEHFRYRFLPIKSEERNTESKLSWPTYYLGLSRLYPIGESEGVQSKSNIPDTILTELMHKHKMILSSDQNYLNSSSIEISDAKKKRGFGVKTDNYSELMNSSGQDNLGQILLSVYSFEILKENLNSSYNGGLLLIDEIDATLHPVAQNKLLDFLEQKSIDLNLQIVFTTHSLSMLNHIISKKEISHRRNDISIVYLNNKRGKLEAIDNPSINFINNDLMNTYSGAHPSKSVPVLTEDDIGRWFMKKIIDFNSNSQNFDFKFIDMHTGWGHIIQLLKHDYMYFKNFVVALDPDINQSDNYSQLKNMLSGTRFTIDKKHTNILILPGNSYVEKMFWEFASNLDAGHAFFYNDLIEDAGLNKMSLIEQGPFSENYKSFTTEKLKIKEWFNRNRWMMEILFDFWVSENEQIVAEFLNKLIEAYNPIYYQRR